MTEWTEPRFERKDVDRAGRLLRDTGSLSIEELNWAFEVMDNWRASHAFPLNTVQVGLRRRARAIDGSALVVQRLKRVQSILRKLERQPTMRLSQMQDLGGCRAIVRSVNAARRLKDTYLKARDSGNVAGTKDYIQEPRPSGYRGIHVIYRYRGGRVDSPASFDGHMVEVQIRSPLQHAWATAVETVGTLLGEALKASEGSGEWLDLLGDISSLFAHAEGTPPVPGAPSKTVLIRQIRAEARRLRMAERLRRFRDALAVIGRTRAKASRYFLLNLNPAGESLAITSFSEGEIELATDEYLKLEREAMTSGGSDIVLVWADSIESLSRAYPNYFVDTEFFLMKVRELTA